MSRTHKLQTFCWVAISNEVAALADMLAADIAQRKLAYRCRAIDIYLFSLAFRSTKLQIEDANSDVQCICPP